MCVCVCVCACVRACVRACVCVRVMWVYMVVCVGIFCSRIFQRASHGLKTECMLPTLSISSSEMWSSL